MFFNCHPGAFFIATLVRLCTLGGRRREIRSVATYPAREMASDRVKDGTRENELAAELFKALPHRYDLLTEVVLWPECGLAPGAGSARRRRASDRCP